MLCHHKIIEIDLSSSSSSSSSSSITTTTAAAATLTTYRMSVLCHHKIIEIRDVVRSLKLGLLDSIARKSDIFSAQQIRYL